MQVGSVRIFRATQDPNGHKSPDGRIEKIVTMCPSESHSKMKPA